MWRKGNPSTLLVGMQTGETTVDNNMEFPQNGQNQEGGRKQGREVALTAVGWRDGEKMQITVIEYQ